jgi:hypothetical protein
MDNLPPFSEANYVEWPRRQEEGNWCTEKVQRHFMTEVHKRFIDGRYSWLSMRDAEDRHFRIVHGKSFAEEMTSRGHPEIGADYADQQCPNWELFERMEFRFDRNTVKIVLPRGNVMGLDTLAFFEDTDMAWSTPSILAEVIDGEPRVVIEIMLVVDWNDELQAKQEYEKSYPRKSFRR